MKYGSFVMPEGVRFRVYAPNARRVSVTGDFCRWGEGTAMSREADGSWSAAVPEARLRQRYKYRTLGADGTERLKADPYARCAELRSGTASVIWESSFVWSDEEWMRSRRAMGRPLNIYEVHAPSWKMHEDVSFYSWRELAAELIPYVSDMGFTHLELLPVTEHPLDASWGYQTTGFFAATARMGDPDGLKALINEAHRSGIGVILDWVPGHFCRDEQGLGRFDGTALYEGGDHPQWGTYTFDFSKACVREFLTDSARCWLTEYHADGLRVDGVSSMLYLNFGLEKDDPRVRHNGHGGEENEAAVDFLRTLNVKLSAEFPGVMMIAEESSAWPQVTWPPESGGLGFHYKWDMGWMNDTLRYCETDFPYRPHAHSLLNFSMMYAFSENFILPLSHDEVVHGKKSLIGRMPGDWWRQFAGLRLLWLYLLTHPGGKLCFMGGEFGQFIEWREYESLEWFLLSYDTHAGLQRFVRDACRLYRREKSLWEQDHGWEGFQWLDADDAAESVLAYRRRAENGEETLCVLHFSPDRCIYRLGVPEPGAYEELLNSDDVRYGGSGNVHPGPLHSEAIPARGMEQSLLLELPSVGGLILKHTDRPEKAERLIHKE